jgi:hypothetical protein
LVIWGINVEARYDINLEARLLSGGIWGTVSSYSIMTQLHRALRLAVWDTGTHSISFFWAL